MSFVKIENLFFGYGTGPTLLQGLSLELQQGEIGALIGPSGSGKSSLLRCIAGFEIPAQGRICVAEKDLCHAGDPGRSVPPHERRIGYLFQSLALFPHMSVAENILYGIHNWPAPQKTQRLEELLQLTGLQGLKDRQPHRLSGGEKQRTALARALAAKPQLVLMDEPFSSLDPDLRQQLRREVRQILKELRTTALIVTHDLDEAYEMCDRAGQIQDGKIRRWSARDDFFGLEPGHRVKIKN